MSIVRTKKSSDFSIRGGRGGEVRITGATLVVLLHKGKRRWSTQGLVPTAQVHHINTCRIDTKPYKTLALVNDGTHK